MAGFSRDDQSPITKEQNEETVLIEPGRETVVRMRYISPYHRLVCQAYSNYKAQFLASSPLDTGGSSRGTQETSSAEETTEVAMEDGATTVANPFVSTLSLPQSRQGASPSSSAEARPDESIDLTSARLVRQTMTSYVHGVAEDSERGLESRELPDVQVEGVSSGHLMMKETDLLTVILMADGVAVEERQGEHEVPSASAESTDGGGGPSQSATVADQVGVVSDEKQPEPAQLYWQTAPNILIEYLERLRANERKKQQGRPIGNEGVYYLFGPSDDEDYGVVEPDEDAMGPRPPPLSREDRDIERIFGASTKHMDWFCRRGNKKSRLVVRVEGEEDATEALDEQN